MERFLPSVVAFTPDEMAEIIVADNGSTDDSIPFLKANYPDIRIIGFTENYGFAEGYNRALALLDHEYVVLLNSDVEVTPDWLTKAVKHLDAHPEIVALQPKICSEKEKNRFEYAGAAGGFIDLYGYPYCRGRVLNAIEYDSHQYDDPVEVLWASGACMFIRLQVYKQAGGMDAYFFAHQEEIDLCWRLVSRGMKICCFPDSVVFHVGGATLKMEHPRKTFLNFRNNLLMVYKNIPRKYFRKVFIVRFFFDYLAALQFLLKGYPGNAFAVWQARRDFDRQKKTYSAVRQQNLEKMISPELPATVRRKSLIISFFLRRKRKYDELG
jgi:GT2 family glycosyltransferase